MRPATHFKKKHASKGKTKENQLSLCTTGYCIIIFCPSVYFLPLIHCSRSGAGAIPAVTGQEAGYILERSLVCGRPRVLRQTSIHTHT